MRTIIISIPLGIVARNILRTDVFRILKNQKDLRIVLVVPPNTDSHLYQEVAGDNIIIEKWRGRVRAGAFRHFILYPFMRNLVYTDSSKLAFRYGETRQPKNNLIPYFLSLIFFGSLSKIMFLKRFCRWVDYNFFGRYDKGYEFLFDQYQPSVVFVNNLLLDPIDMALTRIARRRGIPTMGMVKSWDNLDKKLLTVLPDTFLVWNEKMKNDLTKYQDVRLENIILTGIPQFDIYKNKEIFLSRKDYCQQMGIDPNKKILFFGSSGYVFPHDDEIADVIYQLMIEGVLKEECAMVVRPHFVELRTKTGRFDRFKNYPHVVLDSPGRTSHCFTEHWDPSFEDMIQLANHLYHCDIMITAYSTLSIDAVVFDKPIINVAFDGLYKRPMLYSCVKWYGTTHYQHVVKTKGVRLVYSKEELKEAINQYLGSPSLDKKYRKRLCQKFCYKLDGKASQRIAQCVLDVLNQT